MEKHGTKSRNYCFTVNSTHDFDVVVSALDMSRVKYLIMGRERGDKEKREHLQGYVSFKGPVDWSYVKKRLPTAHIEIAKGNGEHNIAYCSKEDEDVYEFGERPKQGKRTDIDEIKHMMLVEHRRIIDVVRSEAVKNYQTLRYAENLDKYRQLSTEPRPVEVIWIWGNSEAGKSKLAYQLAGKDVWPNGKDLEWFDGYFGQRSVIIDDFRGNQCSFVFFLKLIYIYEIRVPVKGGFTIWNPNKIIITSIKPPREAYRITDTEEEPLHQLERRITKIIHLEQEVAQKSGGNTSTPDFPNEPAHDLVFSEE